MVVNTDTQIDSLLDLRVPKSDFTSRFSTFPIIGCSAPTTIHSGLTLNNETKIYRRLTDSYLVIKQEEEIKLLRYLKMLQII